MGFVPISALVSGYCSSSNPVGHKQVAGYFGLPPSLSQCFDGFGVGSVVDGSGVGELFFGGFRQPPAALQFQTQLAGSDLRSSIDDRGRGLLMLRSALQNSNLSTSNVSGYKVTGRLLLHKGWLCFWAVQLYCMHHHLYSIFRSAR